MKTKIVTSLYFDGMQGFPFYGHEYLARKHRYLHSLRTISNTGEDIILYTNENEFQELDSYCKDHNLTKVKVKISNIWDYPNAQKMKEIKQSTDNFKMYHEIDWNKIYLLEKEYDPSYDYLYWIDVGLSHPGLFLDKYNPYSEEADGKSDNWKNYSYTRLFNENLLNKINNFVGEKLINISNRTLWHNMNFTNQILEKSYIYQGTTVGGILGGHRSKLEWFFQEFGSFSNKSLDRDVILNHEAIISCMYEESPHNFETFYFDTWYHDDYWKNHPQPNQGLEKNLVQFVHFFERVLSI